MIVTLAGVTVGAEMKDVVANVQTKVNDPAHIARHPQTNHT